MKLTKKQKREEEALKSQIKVEEETLRRLIKALVKYNLSQSAMTGVYFREQFENLLKCGIDRIDDSNKTKKTKGNLLHELYGFYNVDGDSMLEINLKHQKRLVHWAKSAINDLDRETKERMVKDSLTTHDLWSEQFNRNSKVYDRLK